MVDDPNTVPSAARASAVASAPVPPAPAIPLDPNPALRAELLAALAILVQSIRGLRALLAGHNSPELRTAISDQIDSRERRRALVQAALDGLDAVVSARLSLAADGYPALDSKELDGLLFAELQQEQADLEAALAVFKLLAMATKLEVKLGDPVEHPAA